MEKMIEFLEGLNFRCIESDTLKIESLIEPIKDENYRYFIRMSWIDDDPKKDVYDNRIVFGIDFISKSRGVYIWLYQSRHQRGNKKWDQPLTINFKPKKIGTKYPDWMSIQDRIDYRRIEKKLVGRGISKEEEDFYNKCYPAVKEINEGRFD